MSLIGEASDSGAAATKHEVKNIKSLSSEVLDLPPSCLEFSPRHPNFFVVGTYYLETGDETPEEVRNAQELKEFALQGEENEIDAKGEQRASHVSESNDSHEGKTANQTRTGSLLLYCIKNEALNLVHAITYPSAILDLHFSPHNGNNFLVASSTGIVSFCRLQMSPRPAILLLSTYSLSDPSTLILSLAWHQSFPGIFGATFSTGTVGIFKITHSAVICIRNDLNPHGDNCWTLAFAPTHRFSRRSIAEGVYSGGDDSRLRFVKVTSVKQLAGTDAKILSEGSTGGFAGMDGHDAGVTAILPLPIYTEVGQNILLTGSYDDKVRVYATYDHRAQARTTAPKVLAELNLGGGVWRLKFLKECKPLSKSETANPSRIHTFRVLASCMFVGARILEVSGSKDGEWNIRILSAFEEHKSMCYASDAQPGDSDQTTLCVSSSFYDRLLCLWRFEE